MNAVDGVHSVGQAVPAALSPVPVENLAERRELIHAVKALNAAEAFGDKNQLTFALDRETHRAVVRIVNRNTNELVRQIPPEYVLRMAEDLKTNGHTLDTRL
jgi:uncharacterized FlaG/YvyC family protein